MRWGGSTYPVRLPERHAVGHIIAPLYVSASPMRTTHLRDPNGPAGTFASESFMDELAARAGVDPIEFRLRHTADARAKAVLTAAAERAKWEPPAVAETTRHGGTSRRPRHGAGAARRNYRGDRRGSRSEPASGAVRVKRLVCAHDCGLIVNPEALRGTIQANLVQSLGRA